MEDPSKKQGITKSDISPSPFPDQGGTQSNCFDSPSKRITVLFHEPRISVFGNVITSMVLEEQKAYSTKQKNTEDLLNLFSGLIPIWKDIFSKLTSKAKSLSSKPYLTIIDLPKSLISQVYPQILSFFTQLVEKLANFVETKPEINQKAFSDELIFIASIGIFQANNIILEQYSQILDLSEADAEAALLDLQENFNSLKIFHEFFYALPRLKCNTILQERHLTILQEITKTVLSTLQMKFQSNLKLLLDTPIQQKKLRAAAFIIYYAIQTIGILSIFGEQSSQTASKYQTILERFKTLFVLPSHSAVFDKIFTEQYDFETEWGYNKGHYTLNSFGQKRLSIFIQAENDKKFAESLEFSLKYVVVYYNYKILKIISQRLKISYDEHILNIFASLIHKNRSLLSTLISSKTAKKSTRVMLHLNENVYIIKSYITNLAFFSDNLDPMQRQAKYDTIKDTTIDCLSLAAKTGMYYKPLTVEEANEISIFEPRDFIALLFKSLLLYKKVRAKKASEKFMSEMFKYVNALATDLVSRPIATDDLICFYSYRLYFLQFLTQWDIENLKEKFTKYLDEMSRYLADFDEDELETEIIRKIKIRNQDLALELYIKLSQIECIQPIENTLSFIRESFTSEKKLNAYFFIMLCLMCRKKLSPEIYKQIMDENPKTLAETIGSIQNSSETDAFILKEGMGVLFLMYKNITSSYIQTKEQRKAYELEMNEPFTRKSVASTEVNNFVAQNYIKKLDETVQSYWHLLKSTEAFICALNYSIPIAKDFLINPEFDQDFYEKTIHMQSGRSLILKLMGILCNHLITNLKNIDLIEKYSILSTAILTSTDIIPIPISDEKPFILSIIGYLEKLINEIVFFSFFIVKKGTFSKRCKRNLF